MFYFSQYEFKTHHIICKLKFSFGNDWVINGYQEATFSNLNFPQIVLYKKIDFLYHDLMENNLSPDALSLYVSQSLFHIIPALTLMSFLIAKLFFNYLCPSVRLSVWNDVGGKVNFLAAIQDRLVIFLCRFLTLISLQHMSMTYLVHWSASQTIKAYVCIKSFY